jgi:hypothetical protein
VLVNFGLLFQVVGFSNNWLKNKVKHLKYFPL